MNNVLKVALSAMLAVLAVSSVAGAAPGDCRLIRGATTPEDPTDDVSACETQTYFHRSAAGLANLNPVPGFDGTAPTATDSAPYAAVLGRLVSTGPEVRPTFQGTFTGNIDTLRVDQFVTIPVYQAASGTYPLIFELSIDGNPLVLESPAAGSEQDVPLVATGEEGIYKMTFAIKNLYQVMLTNGIELGDEVQHTIRLSMAGLYYGDTNGVYWFDSASRPSGIYFNPVNPKGIVYDATNYA
jgi:hypothetical protein